MKILELRFKNLNSLYGEWRINFADPEYLSNGIFSLTGPTGAGKSTILDAICLALYGATPRLGKITKSENEIMSRQTGECYAEVLFESQAGRFRCHWEQHRARKRPDGNLQDQEHQIVDADTGKPLETKKSLVAQVIEEKTGMDFDRFTRSILLAQGGFDTFLKANIEEKSKILEQITGTGIYSKISRRVHERQREEREKLNLLNAEASGISVLEPLEEKNLHDTLLKLEEHESNLAREAGELVRATAWLNEILSLEKEVLTLDSKASQLEIEMDAFKPDRARLEQAIKAASMDGIYATLTSLSQQQAMDEAALKTHGSALHEQEEAAVAQAEALSIAEKRTVNCKLDLSAAAPIIQRIRLLDQKVAEQARSFSEAEDAFKRDAEQLEAAKQAKIREEEKRAAARDKRNAAMLYVKENARDEGLISAFTGITDQFVNFRIKREEIKRFEERLHDAEVALVAATTKRGEASKQTSLNKEELEKVVSQVNHSKANLEKLLANKLLREYRAEKEGLLREKALIGKIVELEERRAELQDGHPCPLCGAMEHPFAKGNVPAPDEIEQKIEALSTLIDSVEEAEQALKMLEGRRTAVSNKLIASEKVEADAIHQQKVAGNSVQLAKETLSNARNALEQIKREVSLRLEPFGIGEIREEEVDELLASLKSRLNRWREETQWVAQIENEISAFDSEVKRIEAQLDVMGKALLTSETNRQRLNEAFVAAKEERKQAYGNKSPDEEESRLQKGLSDAENAEKEIRERHIELQKSLISKKTQTELLQKRIEQRKAELGKAEEDFSAARILNGFFDEKSFAEARLPQSNRDALAKRARELENAQTELNAQFTDRKTRLAGATAQKLTSKTLEELKPQLKECEESLKETRDQIAGLKQRLKENVAAQERIKEKQSAIEAQRRECLQWDRLHGLIGSVDGRKYRNFAQGLTFERMVSHANEQLSKMTDRYLLIRDDKQPLELNVVDSYQAGEVRSTSNLSGGESFIVSLALALGLSKMASRKVRVDSLFLDEGFGTLDEEALETALATLSGLQQDGKLIGIISHVSALKERIRTQITITPISGGRSSIAGPGCGN